jgi:hypothetical protein
MTEKVIKERKAVTAKSRFGPVNEMFPGWQGKKIIT